MNALRVPYEAHTSVVGFASEGSALRSMWRSHGLQPVGAPLALKDMKLVAFGGKKVILGLDPNLIPSAVSWCDRTVYHITQTILHVRKDVFPSKG
jgi:hypothetical protein